MATRHSGFYFDRRRRSTHVVPWQRARAELGDELWHWCNAVTERYLTA